MRIGNQVIITKDGYRNIVGVIVDRDEDLFAVDLVDYDGVVVTDFFEVQELQLYEN